MNEVESLVSASIPQQIWLKIVCQLVAERQDRVAILIDCSGSMYGEAMDSSRIASKRFIEQNISPNCSFAIFTAPGSYKPVAGPTNDPAQLNEAINNLIAVGNSSIQKQLQFARQALKSQGGIDVVVSDGHISEIEEAQKECDRIRKYGGRIFAISVGPSPDKDLLKTLCAAEEDYADAYDGLSIRHALNNILTRVNS